MLSFLLFFSTVHGNKCLHSFLRQRILSSPTLYIYLHLSISISYRTTIRCIYIRLYPIKITIPLIVAQCTIGALEQSSNLCVICGVDEKKSSYNQGINYITIYTPDAHILLLHSTYTRKTSYHNHKYFTLLPNLYIKFLFVLFHLAHSDHSRVL